MQLGLSIGLESRVPFGAKYSVQIKISSFGQSEKNVIDVILSGRTKNVTGRLFSKNGRIFRLGYKINDRTSREIHEYISEYIKRRQNSMESVQIDLETSAIFLYGLTT